MVSFWWTTWRLCWATVLVFRRLWPIDLVSCSGYLLLGSGEKDRLLATVIWWFLGRKVDLALAAPTRSFWSPLLLL